MDFSYTPTNRLAKAVLAIVILSLVVTAGVQPALAQETTTTTTTGNNSTAGGQGQDVDGRSHWIGVGNVSNATGDTVEKAGKESSGSLLGGFGFDPGEWAKDAFRGLANAFLGSVKGGIDYATSAISDLPAPGNPENPRTIFFPQNGLWPFAYQVMFFTEALGIILWLLGCYSVIIEKDPLRRREKLKVAGLSFLMIFSARFVPGIGLHLVGDLAHGIAPQSSDFFRTPGNMAKLSLGLGVGGVVALISTIVAAGAIVALALEVLLAHVLVVLWPAAGGAMNHGPRVKSYYETIINLYFSLCAIVLIQAIFLRFAFTMPLGGDAKTAITSFIIIICGMGFFLLYFPKEMLRHANDAASFTLGAGAAQRGARKLAERPQRKSRQVISDFVQRGRDGGPDDSQPTGGQPETGETFGVGNPRAGGASAPMHSTESVPGAYDHPADKERDGPDIGTAGVDAGEFDRQQRRIDHEQERGFM